MLNCIWLAFLLIAVLVGGFTGRLPEMTKAAFDAAEVAVMKLALPLMGIWAIWLGVMRLAEQSGLVQVLARALRPVMRRLFPDVPPEHPAMGAMMLNMAANMLGLGNAATPLGLRAMAHLERLNPHPGTATNAMCTFLAINTASIQLVPTTAISILFVAGSQNPTAIVVTGFLATCCAASSGIFSAKLMEKLPIFAPPQPTTAVAGDRLAADDAPAPLETGVEAVKVDAPAVTPAGHVVLAAFALCFVAMFVIAAFPEQVNAMLRTISDYIESFYNRGYSSSLVNPAWSVPVSKEMAGKGPGVRTLFAISVLALPFLLSFFPLYAALRRVKVYEQFVEGAKEAFGTAQRVIPFLVAMLVSIAMLKAVGVIDLLTRALTPVLGAVHFPPDLLPLVLMRPLSGSATQGIFIELVNRLGPDTLTSRIAATIYGSTETTFYVIAVYFGSVAIRRTRHAIAAGLIADTVAVIASIAICRLMFN